MKQTFVVAMITLREAMPAGSHEHCTTSTESPAQDGPTYIPSGPGVAQFVCSVLLVKSVLSFALPVTLFR